MRGAERESRRAPALPDNHTYMSIHPDEQFQLENFHQNMTQVDRVNLAPKNPFAIAVPCLVCCLEYGQEQQLREYQQTRSSVQFSLLLDVTARQQERRQYAASLSSSE